MSSLYKERKKVEKVFTHFYTAFCVSRFSLVSKYGNHATKIMQFYFAVGPAFSTMEIQLIGSTRVRNLCKIYS